METMAGHATDLVRSLEDCGDVPDVARVTGPYDVIAVVEAADLNSISGIVNDYIHSLAGVIRTTTCVTLR